MAYWKKKSELFLFQGLASQRFNRNHKNYGGDFEEKLASLALASTLVNKPIHVLNQRRQVAFACSFLAHIGSQLC